MCVCTCVRVYVCTVQCPCAVLRRRNDCLLAVRLRRPLLRDPPASAPKTKKARRRRGRDPGQVPNADDMEETPAETAQAREGEPWRKPEAIGELLAV